MTVFAKKNKLSIVKPSRLVFLIVLIASNTFAWFIYATKVDSNVSVHVRSWNVVFEAGENEITDTVNLTVDNVYPGMEDYEYEVTAYNRSEVSANLTYQVLSANILGAQIVSKEQKEMLGQPTGEEDLTSSEIEEMLANDYPFSITMGVSDSTISMGDGSEQYTLEVTWPYESNHDDVDTMWGIMASQYKESNPNSPSITLNVKIVITQNPN